MNAILIRSLIFTGAVVGLLTAAGCSSSSGSSPAPASPTTPPTTTSGTLSAAFATNCASCHGKDGSTKAGGKSALKSSTAYTTTSWESAVRNGKGTMPPFETADYSDVNMKADYKVLTGKTWQ